MVGAFYLTIAALLPLLCDLTLALFLDVIALEAGAWVFLTFSFTLQLCGDDILEGHRRWRWCLLQLLGASKPIDLLIVLPPVKG